jgi:hypothetical protein
MSFEPKCIVVHFCLTYRRTGYVDVEAVLRLPRFSGYHEEQVGKVFFVGNLCTYYVHMYANIGSMVSI